MITGSKIYGTCGEMLQISKIVGFSAEHVAQISESSSVTYAKMPPTRILTVLIVYKIKCKYLPKQIPWIQGMSIL